MSASRDSDSFLIRDYVPEDFQRLWQIDQLCFPPGISYTQADLRAFISLRDAFAIVAERVSPTPEAEHGIIGFAIGQISKGRAGSRVGRIVTLDVVPESRRSGLGTRLMAACEQRMGAAGCRQVYLETAVNNEPALRMYARLGYEVVGRVPDYYESHSLDAYVLQKQL